MKTPTKALCAFALAFCAVAATPAFAHHSRVHFGFYFGGPAWYPAPYYYPPPAYYYPPPVVVQQPPVYVEQHAPAPPAPAPQSSAPQSATDSSWYYCRDTQAYYPYVQSCASPWQRVAPRPAGS